MGGALARLGEMRHVHKILVGKRKGNRPLGKHRSRWEDNIKMIFKELGYEVVDWFLLTQRTDKWWALVNNDMKMASSGL
jgi:hypothetical protein